MDRPGGGAQSAVDTCCAIDVLWGSDAPSRGAKAAPGTANVCEAARPRPGCGANGRDGPTRTHHGAEAEMPLACRSEASDAAAARRSARSRASHAPRDETSYGRIF